VASSKERTWQTWAGSGSDIDRAIREAADAIAGWTNYPAVVTGTVSFADDLTETLKPDDPLSNLHASDLSEIQRLWVEILPDRDAYHAEQARLRDVWRTAAEERARRGEEIGEPDQLEPLESASAAMRFSWGGRALLLEVTGEDRDRVVGLFDRLEHTLCRRQAFRKVDPSFVAIFAAALLLLPSLLLATFLVQGFGFASANGQWEWQEIAALVLGLAVPAGIAFATAKLYPRLEILADGERTRAERFGAFLLGAVVALILGVVASVAYSFID
jgi:hypothetical protein